MADTSADWDLFRKSLHARVTPVTWQTWLQPLTHGDAADSNVVQVVAPSDFHLRWVADKYRDVLEDVVASVYGPERSLELVAASPADTAELEPIDLEEALESDEADTPTTTVPLSAATLLAQHRLAPKYRFENFVVGQSNRFAHAAAMAVAEQPGAHYNPLFIYGGAGLGKTHLLHAVGHHALELAQAGLVRYVTSENFFNDFIDSIRRKRMDEFKTRYRTTDILLLDDVQFFEGKEQILEEFFHTFNDLYEAGKQMVISCDRHPRDLSTLEDRLRSRFEWGLLTDIQPPDVETRLAILRKNSDLTPQGVSEDVLEFIAHHVEDNIRELEGALTRVTAYAALTNQPIDLVMAQDVLQDLVPCAEIRPLAPDEIVLATAAVFGFSTPDLQGPSRRQPLVLARQIGMYLCRELTDLSLPKIGDVFGGRDHSTVLHAVDKVKRLMQTDHEVFERVTALSQSLRRN